MNQTTTQFKVLEDDHHDQMSVHVFRDEQQFFDWICERDEDFDGDAFQDDGVYEDGNGVSWSKFTGHYEVDHTKED